MITCFDQKGTKIAEFNPAGPMAAVSKPLCESCDWLRKADLECWHPSQKCATRTRPWQFAACPGDCWNAPAAGLQGPGKPTATLVLRIPGEDWTGFGQTANLIAQALLSRGIDFVVTCINFCEAKCPLPREIRRRIVSPAPDGLPVLSICSIPGPGALGSQNETLFTLWETTQAPAQFRPMADRCRLVITASEWGRQVFAQATSTPVVCVPMCIDPAAWPQHPMPGGPFTFLCAGRLAHGGKRKGLGTVIDAFLAEFPHEDVRLRIKGWSDCKMEFPKDPRIDLVDSYLHPTEMSQWYASGHVFVSAATSEGFGLHQLQAMCSGRPLIAAAYSAMADYLTKSTGYPVKYREVPNGGAYYHAGNWAELDMVSLRSKMREAYHGRPSLLRRGAAAARRARDYTLDATAVGVIRAMHQSGCLRQQTFYHAGDIGDVLYSLPTMKALGGGNLLLGPRVKLGDNLRPRCGINEPKCESMRSLLEHQSYIHRVDFSPGYPEVDFDLNKFRYYWAGQYREKLVKLWHRQCASNDYPLAWIHAAAFDIGFDETQPWLQVPTAGHHWKYVINRTARAHGKTFPWGRVVERFKLESIFLGTKAEYQDFCQRFGKIDYLTTPTLLAAAGIIADCTVFLGNTSAPLAIAQGLGKRRVVECRDDGFVFDSDYDPSRQLNYRTGDDPRLVFDFLTPKTHDNITLLYSHPKHCRQLPAQPGIAETAALAGPH